jgi:EAL domain-containing protein (putative c-di-GMP-specific phosphodiesterase class I)/GGDEF domain-containing protein
VAREKRIARDRALTAQQYGKETIMQRYSDDFEGTIIRRLFLGFSGIFTLMYCVSVYIMFLFPGSIPHGEIVLAIRYAAIGLNACAFFVVLAWKDSTPWARKAGTGLLLGNAALSMVAYLLALNDFTYSTLTFLFFTVYALLFGLFVRRVWATAVFSTALLAAFFVIHIGFPGTFFGISGLENRRTVTLITGIVLSMILLVLILSVSIHTAIYGDLRKKQRFLENLAFHDQETGIANARKLAMSLTAAIAELRGKDEVCVLAGIRLARLEELGERLGFDGTSQWLTSFSTALSANVRAWTDARAFSFPVGPTLFRAEHAILVFPFIVRAEPAPLMDKLPEELSEIVNVSLRETRSESLVDYFGAFAAYPSDAADASALARNVLRALHRIDARAKSQFSPFDPEAFERFLRKEHLEEQMLSDSFKSEITPFFQPKIAVSGGACAGFEALARWNSPILGSVPPSEFIAIAEQNRSIMVITDKILEDTARFIDTLARETDDPVRIAVNLSPTLLNPKKIDELARWIAKRKIGPWLEIEITEGTLLGMTADIEKSFARIKETGVTFAIDDFGTGYSNLAYLQHFDAEIIKIDKRFIDGIPGDGKNATLVRAILQMTRSLGMKCVAEGVEYRDQAIFLRQEGCDQIQGYLYSKPLSAEGAIAWFRENAAKRSSS